MENQSVTEQARQAVREALAEYGREDATAEVLSKMEALPYDGNDYAYAQQVANLVSAVWERKIARADVRVQALRQQLTALTAMNLRPPSDIVH